MTLTTLIPVLHGPPDAFFEREGRKLIAWLNDQRRWDDAALVEGMLANQAITVNQARLAESIAYRESAKAHDYSMCVAAVHLMREYCHEHNVLEAPFIDDCMMNAIVQRNLIARETESLIAILSTLAMSDIGPRIEELIGQDPVALAVNVRKKLSDYGYRYDAELRAGRAQPEDHPAEAGQVQAEV
jgi:hypothetical protein